MEKMALISEGNENCLIPLGEMCLEESYIYEFFESTLYMKSGSMPLKYSKQNQIVSAIPYFFLSLH